MKVENLYPAHEFTCKVKVDDTVTHPFSELMEEIKATTCKSKIVTETVGKEEHQKSTCESETKDDMLEALASGVPIVVDQSTTHLHMIDSAFANKVQKHISDAVASTGIITNRDSFVDVEAEPNLLLLQVKRDIAQIVRCENSVVDSMPTATRTTNQYYDSSITHKNISPVSNYELPKLKTSHPTTSPHLVLEIPLESKLIMVEQQGYTSLQNGTPLDAKVTDTTKSLMPGDSVSKLALMQRIEIENDDTHILNKSETQPTQPFEMMKQVDTNAVKHTEVLVTSLDNDTLKVAVANMMEKHDSKLILKLIPEGIGEIILELSLNQKEVKVYLNLVDKHVEETMLRQADQLKESIIGFNVSMHTAFQNNTQNQNRLFMLEHNSVNDEKLDEVPIEVKPQLQSHHIINRYA